MCLNHETISPNRNNNQVSRNHAHHMKWRHPFNFGIQLNHGKAPCRNKNRKPKQPGKVFQHQWSQREERPPLVQSVAKQQSDQPKRKFSFGFQEKPQPKKTDASQNQKSQRKKPTQGNPRESDAWQHEIQHQDQTQHKRATQKVKNSVDERVKETWWYGTQDQHEIRQAPFKCSCSTHFG